MFSLVRKIMNWSAMQVAKISRAHKEYNVPSLSEKSIECVVSDFSNLDEVSAKLFYKDILTAVKEAVSDDKIDSLIHLSLILTEINKIRNDECLTDCQQTEAIGHFNLIPLACKNKAIKVLEYIFSEGSQTLYCMSMKLTEVCEKELFSITDEFCHNAFYYAIRSNMTDLLTILFNKAQTQLNDEELDDLLSESYKELKLRNVSLTRQMQLFVQGKILDFRFFHTSTDVSSGTGNSWKEIKKRIELVIRYAQSLKTDYWDKDPDDKFIFIAEFITKSLHVLKFLLKSTYDRLPWEEIEFCLIVFLRCCKNSSEPNLVYNCVLSKKKLLMHLFKFSVLLGAEHEKFKNNNVIKLAKSVKLARDIVIEKITKKNRELHLLYDDYEKVRDYNSLEIIKRYADLIEPSDSTEKPSHLLVSRVLQIMGEHLKNTLDSPKLSTKTANALLSYLSFDTRNLITKLRDSLSHEESLYIRSEIETKVHLFKNLPTDISKIKVEITNMLYIIRIDSVKNLMQKVRLCESFEDVRDLYGPFHSSVDLHGSEIESTFLNTSVKGDLERLEQLVSLLGEKLNDKTMSEISLFVQIQCLIKEERDRLENVMRANLYSTAFHRKVFSSGQMYNRDMLCVIRDLVDYSSEASTLGPSSMPLREFKSIETLLRKLLDSVHSRLQRSSGNFEVYNIVISIIDFIHFEKGNVKWIEQFRDIIRENKISVHPILPENLLISKLSVLKESLSELGLKDGGSNVDFSSFASNPELRAEIEILVLDILSLLESSFSRNPFFLDSDYPFLIGKNLRNHLAHENALTKICLEDSSAQLLENALKILTLIMSNDGKKIDKVIKCDCIKLESSIDYSLRIISNQEKLFAALEEGNLADVEVCMHGGADIYGKDNGSSTCLHYAGKAPDIATLKWILTQGLDISSKDNVGQTVLHTAAKLNRTEVIQFLVEQRHMSLDTTDANGKTPLHVAVENQSNEVVEYISKLERNLTLKDYHGSTAAHIAVYKHNTHAAKILLDKETNVDANRSHGNLTALHVATLNENLNLVKLLIAKKANVNSKDDFGVTPLHYASSLGNFEIAEYLVSKYADVNARNEAGATPLQYAMDRGKKKIVELLLIHKADVNESDDEQFTPLMMAAIRGYAPIAELLVQTGAIVNAQENSGYTALHFAAMWGHLQTVELLLNHKAAVDCKNQKNETALHLSAAFGHKEVVKLLLKVGADIHATDSRNATPLLAAAAHGNKDIVDIIIDEGADINCKDEAGLTALHHAAAVANRGIVESLLKKGADIRASNADKVTPLPKLIFSGLSDLLTPEWKDVIISDANGFTLLHFAALFGDQQLVEYCLDNSCEINARNNSGITALHFAAQSRHPKIVSLLLNKGAEIEAKDENGSTPLFLAVKSECKDTVKVLVSHERYDMKAASDDKIRALLCSVFCGKSDVAEILLQNYKFDFSDELKQQLLDNAVRINQKHIVVTLLDRGFEINGGTELLFTAVEFKHYEMVEFLISKGANPMLLNEHNLTPLQRAASLGDAKMVELLLSQKSNIRKGSEVILSTARIAICKKNLDVMKILLQMKVIDVNARYEKGFTLLHTSAYYGILDITTFLVAEGANINLKDEDERKPVHIAAEKGFKDLVEFYLNCKDLGDEIASLLLFSASGRNATVGEFLRKMNPYRTTFDWNVVNQKHLASLKGHIDVTCVVLQYGAYYNEFPPTLLQLIKVADVVGLFSKIEKLYTAVQNNAASEVENLLKGESISVTGFCIADSKCKINESALHFASLSGYKEIVDILLKYDADPNTRTEKGDTPLHYAAKYSHFIIVKALLSNGAIYNGLSQTGETPLDYATDKEIRDFLIFLKSIFTKVQDKDVSVLEDLRGEDEGAMRSMIRAKNVEGKTLIDVAYIYSFPEVDKLQMLFEYDIKNDLIMAQKLFSEERYTEAFSTYECVLRRRLAIFGPESHPVLDVKYKLAEVCEIQQDFEKALNYFKEVHNMRKNSLGKHHKKTLASETRVAYVLLRQGKKQEALDIFKSVHFRQKEICQLGDTLDESNVIGNKLGMSTTLYEMNRLDEALKYIIEVEERCSQIKEKLLIVLTYFEEMKALIFCKQGKYSEALELFKNVYKLRENDSPHNSDTLIALSNIANTLLLQKKFDESFEVYTKVLDIQRSHLPEDHIDILQSEFHIGEVLLGQQMLVAALKTFFSIEKRLLALGPMKEKELALMRDIKDRVEALKNTFSRSGFQSVFERIKEHSEQSGKKRLQRAIQVLEILGGEVPEFVKILSESEW